MKTTAKTNMKASALRAVFSKANHERSTLNNAIRVLFATSQLEGAENAEIAKNAKTVCNWLGITSAALNGRNAFNETRNRLMKELPFMLEDAAASTPCKAVKVAEIDGKGYFAYRATSWLQALEMLAKRYNAGFEAVQVQRVSTAFYTVDGNAVDDENILKKIAEAVAAKEDEKAAAAVKKAREVVKQADEIAALKKAAEAVEIKA